MVDIQSFLEQLAVALTTDDQQWSVVPEPYPDSRYRTIIDTQHRDPDPFGLNLSFNNQNDRVTISPVAPYGVDLHGSRFAFDYDKPKISVDAARPIEAIVADIHRRLLRHAQIWWTGQCVQAAQSHRRYAAVMKLQQDLQDLFPEGRMRDASVFSGPGFTIKTASTSDDAEITFDRRPHDQIIRLLTLYRQHILNKQGDSSYGR